MTEEVLAAPEPVDSEDLPEVDRELTPEEQIEELKAMLADGRISICKFDRHFQRCWSQILEARGEMTGAKARLSYQASSRKLSAAGSAVNLTANLNRKSRASRKSKEMYQESVIAEPPAAAPESPGPGSPDKVSDKEWRMQSAV